MISAGVHGDLRLGDTDIELTRLQDNSLRLQLRIGNTTEVYKLARNRHQVETLLVDEDEALSSLDRYVSLRRNWHDAALLQLRLEKCRILFQSDSLYEDEVRGSSVIIEQDPRGGRHNISGEPE